MYFRADHLRLGFAVLVILGSLLLAAPKVSAQPEGCEAVNGSSNWFQSTCNEVGEAFRSLWSSVSDLFERSYSRQREIEAAKEAAAWEFFVDWIDEVEVVLWPTFEYWAENMADAMAEVEDEARYLAEQEMHDINADAIADFTHGHMVHGQIARAAYDELGPGFNQLEDLIDHPAIVETLEAIRLDAPPEHPILTTVAKTEALHAEARHWFIQADHFMGALSAKLTDLEEVPTHIESEWFDYPDGLEKAIADLGERTYWLSNHLEEFFKIVANSPFGEDTRYEEWVCDLEWWLLESLAQHEIRGGVDTDWASLPVFGGCPPGEPHAEGIPVAGGPAPPKEEIYRVVQLGDSYSAGFGGLADWIALPPGRDHCDHPWYRNEGLTPGRRLWQHLVETTSNPVTFHFAACGGAEVTQRDLETQWNAVLSETGNLGDGEGTIIVFTFGGNDFRTRRGLSWPELVSHCILTNCIGGTGRQDNAISNLHLIAGEYYDQLLEISHSVPKATIRVLGYPVALQPFWRDGGEERPFPAPSEDDALICPGTPRLSTEEAAFLDNQFNRLRPVLKNVVEESASFNWINMSFVDVRPAFDGHGACNRPAGVPEPLIHGVDWIHWPQRIQANSLHPVEGGWNAYFLSLMDSLGY